MRFPKEWYQLVESTEQHLPDLRSSQLRGLVLWVYGTLLAKSACQNAVIGALSSIATFHALRQYLREFLRDGADKATPCNTQLDVTLCFAPLLRWLLTLWKGQQLALAIDATAHGTQVVALVVSVLYRGSAIPCLENHAGQSPRRLDSRDTGALADPCSGSAQIYDGGGDD